jgi:predicted DNA-binding WGR domain protein
LKDRDERIIILKCDVDLYHNKFKDIDTKHTSLIIQYDKIGDELEMLKKDYEATSEHLKHSNKVRNELTIKLAEEQDK